MRMCKIPHVIKDFNGMARQRNIPSNSAHGPSISSTSPSITFLFISSPLSIKSSYMSMPPKKAHTTNINGLLCQIQQTNEAIINNNLEVMVM